MLNAKMQVQVAKTRQELEDLVEILLRNGSYPVLLISGVASESLPGSIVCDQDDVHYAQFRANLGLEDCQKTKSLYKQLRQTPIKRRKNNPGICTYSPEGFSTRVYKALLRLRVSKRYENENVQTLADVCRYSLSDLPYGPGRNPGSKTRAEIQTYLQNEFGVSLPEY